MAGNKTIEIKGVVYTMAPTEDGIGFTLKEGGGFSKKQIREITNKAKTWCLVGMTGFDEDVQQQTCHFFNKYCSCRQKYLSALQSAKTA